MKRILLGLILALAGMSPVWADGYVESVGPTTTSPRLTLTVFNDSGAALTSGTVVIWDNDDTEFDRSGYPYVTTTTTADDPWTAGVTIEGSCPDQALCSIVAYGPARTNINTADTIAEDTLLGTDTTAGTAGDYGTGANTCTLGMLTEVRNLDTGYLTYRVSTLAPMMVFVDPDCN